MPTISMFFGIIIRMYFDDHNPPHFHAFYQEYRAVFSLDGQMISGDMPEKQSKIIEVWAMLHKDELDADGQLAKDQQELYKIEPLR